MRSFPFMLAGVLLSLACVSPASAGLHYSDEAVAELPSQWRGYLLDQRMLRMLAIKPTPARPASLARLRYEEALKKLEKLAKEGSSPPTR